LFLLIAMLADQGSPVGEVIEYLNGSRNDPPLHKAFATRCLAEAAVTGNQPLANLVFVDLAKAIENYAGSRQQQAVAFIEEALQAFSMLARIVPVPKEVRNIIQILEKEGSLPARMAAWQLGFAMQSAQERMNYALDALKSPEEAVRRGAI